MSIIFGVFATFVLICISIFIGVKTWESVAKSIKKVKQYKGRDY